MKTIALTSVLALTSAALFAGTPAYVEAQPMRPAPQPSLLNWFAGGTVGYLDDAEEELYTGHIGVDLPQPAFGGSQAIYLEVGYTELETRERNFDDVELDEGFAGTGPIFNTSKLQIIPITLNYKLEFPLTQQLNWYIGAGAGIALLDADINDFRGRRSDDDTSFFAQAVAGILYNVSESFEVYAGGRWIYIDGATLFGEDLSSDDDIAAEVGFRFNF